jgi:hypothetical protein
MGDGEGRASFNQSEDRFLNLLFRLHVDGRGGLVENENGRVVKDGSGDGDALLFSSREIVSPLAHFGVVAVSFGTDELVRIGRFGSCNDGFKGCVRLAVADVVSNGSAEQDR